MCCHDNNTNFKFFADCVCVCVCVCVQLEYFVTGCCFFFHF